ncbi:sugar phosphate isomerase/epimerase family protein [Rhodococcus opacus]|uniref:sugar phosphate isomerase/epimerase family protein n=1 Tax=Rhodococcus opacus TaxID=37919 RepID=UPI001601B4F7|nr:sugar phosphate isomerase/epimerase family protein [Rhodococcus opacus]QZS52706.1 sugar phosphate isomerase/epimerase [Rhodococcus opacus]
MIEVNGRQQYVVLANMTTVTTASFRKRVEVAAAAGFDALGISLDTYRRVVAEEMSPKALQTLLADNGLEMVELEAVFGFAVPTAETGVPFGGGLVYTSPDDLNEFWAMAELFGARHLQAVGAFDRTDLEPDVVERFASLCDRAADVGLQIALEFVPTTNIPDAGTALSIVEQSGRENAGLCVDSWHHTRGANDLEMLRSIPSQRVTMIQINDGPKDPADPDYLVETLHHRAVPGAGDFDLDGFVDAVTEGGVTAPVSVEVISDDLARLEPAEAARRCYDGAIEALARKGCVVALPNGERITPDLIR